MENKSRAILYYCQICHLLHIYLIKYDNSADFKGKLYDNLTFFCIKLGVLFVFETLRGESETIKNCEKYHKKFSLPLGRLIILHYLCH